LKRWAGEVIGKDFRRFADVIVDANDHHVVHLHFWSPSSPRKRDGCAGMG
jgi:hypothetical protein